MSQAHICDVIERSTESGKGIPPHYHKCSPDVQGQPEKGSMEALPIGQVAMY
jgi:hypothetical protein